MSGGLMDHTITVTVQGFVPGRGSVTKTLHTATTNLGDIGARTAELVDSIASQQLEAWTEEPEWRAGDVFLHQFSDDGPSYTYVVTKTDPFTTSGALNLYQLSVAWRFHRAVLAMRGSELLDPPLCVFGDRCTVSHTIVTSDS